MSLVDIEEGTELVLTWRIDAGRDRVWRCLIDPELVQQWLGKRVDGGAAPGSSFAIDHGDGYVCRSRVDSYVERADLGFTWQFPDEPTSHVTIELTAHGDVTELRLTHAALGPLVSSYRDGWSVHLTYLEAAAQGTPLPASMFWTLHATVARLAEIRGNASAPRVGTDRARS